MKRNIRENTCYVNDPSECLFFIEVLRYKRRVNILRTLSPNPKKALRATEIANQINEYVPHVYNDLRKLEKLGFVKQLPNKKWITTFSNTKVWIENGYVMIENCPLKCQLTKRGYGNG